MRHFIVLLETNTISNFASDSYPIKFLTNTFATGKISDSAMTSAFFVLGHQKKLLHRMPLQFVLFW